MQKTNKYLPRKHLFDRSQADKMVPYLNLGVRDSKLACDQARFFLSDNQGGVRTNLHILLRDSFVQLQSRSCKIVVSCSQRIRDSEMAAGSKTGAPHDVSRFRQR